VSVKSPRDVLRGLLGRHEFCPGYLGLLTNPFYLSRRSLYLGLLKHSREIGGRVLDVGCGSMPYRHLVKCDEYVGMEVEGAGKKVDCYFDGKHFPFPDQSFDSIISTQVFEHCQEPDLFLHECHRVLRREGKLLFTAPLVWGEHERPHDYWRFTSYGLERLLAKHGFKTLASEKLVSGLKALVQIATSLIHEQAYAASPKLVLPATLAILFPMNAAAICLSCLLPKSDSFYLDNLALAIKQVEPASSTNVP